MKKLKSENGAITLLVLITMLFIISFLITTHVIVSNKFQGQLERSKEIQKVYDNYNEAENAYRNLIANNTININNVDQLLKIGTGDTVVINGKNYIFSTSAIYVLMSDLSFAASEYSTELGGVDWTPIGDTNYNFDGNGHTITVTKLNGVIKEYNLENEYKN